MKQEDMKAWVIRYVNKRGVGYTSFIVVGTQQDAEAKADELNGSWAGPYEFKISVKP